MHITKIKSSSFPWYVAKGSVMVSGSCRPQFAIGYGATREAALEDALSPFASCASGHVWSREQGIDPCDIPF